MKKAEKNKAKNNFNVFFENRDLTPNEEYSFAVIISIIKSLLEPIVSNNSNAIIFSRFQQYPQLEGIVKRLEYCTNVTMRKFSDFEMSKFDVEDVGFLVLTTQRYNAAFLFRKSEENQDKYETYLRLNSKLVNDVYERIKEIFLINYDEDFYEHRPERRENYLLNGAIANILKYFEESTQENEYNTKIQENYKTVNETNTTFRNEMYENAKQIAHEIKNQLSILDIYTRIYEKKSGDTETIEPIRKSIGLIKSQIEQFKSIEVINLQEKNVKDIIQQSIKVYQQLLKDKNNKLILVDEMPAHTALAFVDEEKFAIVINNLIKNANDSTQNDEIIIRLYSEDEKIKIAFINHGEMIAKENQPRVFEQGFTTKKDGWGIGLSVCQRMIGSQFGSIELTKSDEKETIFTLSISLA